MGRLDHPVWWGSAAAVVPRVPGVNAPVGFACPGHFRTVWTGRSGGARAGAHPRVEPSTRTCPDPAAARSVARTASRPSGAARAHVSTSRRSPDEQAEHPRRRRRPARRGGDRPRPAHPLRRRLPGAPGHLGRRGARRAGSPRAARRPGGADRLRPADAADDRHRADGAGPRPRAGREEPAAHGVRRHRRGDPGDQRDRPRPLPAQAVGPARGTPLPGGRRPARGLAPRAPRPHLRRPGHRAPLVRAQPRAQDVPGPQLRAVPVVRRGARRRGRPAPRARLGRARRPARWCCCPTGDPLRSPTTRDLAQALGLRTARRPAALRRLHRRRRPGRARRRGVRRLRGAADRGRGARGARRAGRPERLDRELPRLPQGAQRRRPHPARDGPGGPVRRRDRARPGRRRVRVARAGARRTVRGVRRAGGPLADRDHRGVLPAPRGRRASTR